MSLTVTGKIVALLKPEKGVSRAGNEWKKQDFVIETTDQFPKKICFTLFNDKITNLEGFSEGDEVEVSFSIESRDYNGKWFHNINAWKISNLVQKPLQESPPEYRIEDIPPELSADDSNDLPF
jgi:hypothetical protein